MEQKAFVKEKIDSWLRPSILNGGDNCVNFL